jgi:hypothetical protein
MKEPTFWKYIVPSVDGLEGWGIFVLDSTGYFSAVTDYGNYAFLWTHHGFEDFREFLMGLDKDYLCSKLGKRSYDGDLTLDNIKDQILQLRRDGTFTKEKAREEWDLLEYNNLENEVEFSNWLGETSIDEAWELARSSYGPDMEAFVTRLYPRFVKELKYDLVKDKMPFSDWEFQQALWVKQWVRRNNNGTIGVSIVETEKAYDWAVSREVFGETCPAGLYGSRLDLVGAKNAANAALKEAIVSIPKSVWQRE